MVFVVERNTLRIFDLESKHIDPMTLCPFSFQLIFVSEILSYSNRIVVCTNYFTHMCACSFREKFLDSENWKRKNKITTKIPLKN